MVARTTASADELTQGELLEGARKLKVKATRYRPRLLAFLGIGAYRVAFARPRATLGPQPETVGPCGVWILPNPSGLNAHYQPADLARLFRALQEAAGRS